MIDYLRKSEKDMCLGSHDLVKFREINDNVSETAQCKEIVAIKD